MVVIRSHARGAYYLLDMKIARKISPIIIIGVRTNPGIQGNPHGKPHGNPHGKPQGNPHGNPVIDVKPEKINAQMNTAKSIPNIGDPSSKGP